VTAAHREIRPDDLPLRKPLGARPLGDVRTEIRVWAPNAEQASVRAGGADMLLQDAGYGVFAGVAEVGPGDDYEIVLDGEAWPDPATRWQPEGMRGPSRVLDTGAFAWTDEAFRAAPLTEAVLYEIHVGTFTPEGTFGAVVPRLRALRELGVTHIELMPVADGPGDRTWGYDGVYISAAHRAYGGPHELARLVDAAHAEGLGVILDVVYNHVGASGNEALAAFGPYFTDRYSTFWGEAINYDDKGADGVREWVLQSAVMWVEEFHVDGLRLDAIHAIYDTSARHVLAELADRVHRAGPQSLVIAESGLNDPKVMRPHDRGGFEHDAAWADDFHHALRVLLTGDQDGYYQDFGDVWQLAKAYRRPHVHDGTWSDHRERVFGAPAPDVPPERFVVFAQNHDQVGNRAFGDRLPREVQPLAALCTLLSPFTPMLFMGEEHGEPAPFQFFSDHIDEEIAIATREGRRREFAAFASFGHEVPDPQAVATFEASKLTWQEDAAMKDLYRRALALRRELGGAGDADEIAFDEDHRWLRVRRGGATVVANFAGAEQAVPLGEAAAAAGLVLATHEGVRLTGDGAVRLPAKAGAVTR
jgi:maltooligosyltrehalose trehalohydrolase